MPEDIKAVEEKVKQAITKVLDVSVEDIKKDSTLAELGGDSLSALGIISNLEQLFDVDIPDEAAQKIDSFASAVVLIQECMEDA